MKKKRSKKKKFSFFGEYKKCWDFLKNSREYIYFAVLVFFIFVVIGFFFEDLINIFFKSIFNFDLKENILDYIAELLLATEGMGARELIGYIFLNNLQSSFLGIIFGIFFGIFPFVATIFNGYLLGFVAILSVKEQGILVLWRILPHGIFELPAIFISFALGFRLGIYVFREKEKYSFKELIFHSLRVFLLVIFPLLVVAAIIEGILIGFG